jgi:TonB family protein
MRKTIYLAAVWVLCGSALGGGLLRAQDEQPTASRKIVTKVMPEYPALARVAHLSGIAKVEAKVGSNGRVESVEIRGGHPLLAQAAANAVSKWRWEPSGHETEEIVDVKFVADSQ